MGALLTESAITAALARVPRWHREAAEITRTFSFRNFAEAVAFVNRVADRAEEANHHPDIDIRWSKVTLRLATHSQGGLTAADFALAACIDALPGSEENIAGRP